MWVYIIIVLYIVLMIRWPNKQRIKINDLDTKLAKIIKLIKHTLQIATIELSYTHIGWIFIPILNLTDVFAYITVFIIKHVIRFITIAKSIGKYLVHNCALCPVRCLKSRHNLEIIISIKFFNSSYLIVIAYNLSSLYLEIII